jgi:uncharacterized protein YuzE
MIKPLLEYDEAADAAYISFSDAEWDHQVRLDDARGINYGADGSVIGVELLSPRRKGVLLDGLPYPDDIARVVRAVGFRILASAADLA